VNARSGGKDMAGSSASNEFIIIIIIYYEGRM